MSGDRAGEPIALDDPRGRPQFGPNSLFAVVLRCPGCEDRHELRRVDVDVETWRGIARAAAIEPDGRTLLRCSRVGCVQDYESSTLGWLGPRLRVVSVLGTDTAAATDGARSETSIAELPASSAPCSDASDSPTSGPSADRPSERSARTSSASDARAISEPSSASPGARGQDDQVPTSPSCSPSAAPPAPASPASSPPGARIAVAADLAHGVFYAPHRPDGDVILSPGAARRVADLLELLRRVRAESLLVLLVLFVSSCGDAAPWSAPIVAFDVRPDVVECSGHAPQYFVGENVRCAWSCSLYRDDDDVIAAPRSVELNVPIDPDAGVFVVADVLDLVVGGCQ